MAKGKYEYWISPEGLLLLEAWTRDGLTDEQLAHNMNIVPSTLYDWKKRYPEISESLKKGKAVIDIQVENALLKRALGYAYKELKKEVSDDGIKVTEITKEVVPDTTAQIFWLKNRKVKEWGGQQQIKLIFPGVENKEDPSGIRDILLAVIDMVASGDMDIKKANTIITAGNAVLNSIRTDEQDKKIQELQQLLERVMEDKRR